MTTQPTPRVLQVSAFFAAHGGGIEAVAEQLALRLAGQGVAVRWFAGGSPLEHPRHQVRGLHIDQAHSIDPVEDWLGLPMPLWGPMSLWRLWRAVGSCDVVHIHDYLYQPTLLAALFAMLRRKPYVMTQHIGEIPFRSARARQLLERLNRTIGRCMLSRANQVVFVGRSVKSYFEGYVRFARPPLLVANGVDRARFHAVPRGPRGASDPVRLLFVGRFVEKKGMALIRACLDIPGVHWTFVGWGPMAPSIDPVPHVRVTGRLPGDEVAALMQQADLLVLPSTGEGFPLVVQEALACGTPVLVSREVAEVFPATDATCVFDVELRTDQAGEALRSALVCLVAQRERLAAGRAAATRLASQWSWEDCVASYRHAYDLARA